MEKLWYMNLKHFPFVLESENDIWEYAKQISTTM